jgi:hypothetical protein
VIVAEEEARSGIAGDVDIGPAVIIKIGRDGSKPVTSRRFGYARGYRYVSECAVSVIVIKRVAAVGQTTRPAEDAFVVAGRAFTRARDGLRVEGDVIRDEQIELAVAIVVEESTPAAEAGLLIPQTRFFGDIGKRSVSVVAVKRVLRPSSDKDVVEAVVVEIGDGYAVGLAGVE